MESDSYTCIHFEDYYKTFVIIDRDPFGSFNNTWYTIDRAYINLWLDYEGLWLDHSSSQPFIYEVSIAG